MITGKFSPPPPVENPHFTVWLATLDEKTYDLVCGEIARQKELQRRMRVRAESALEEEIAYTRITGEDIMKLFTSA